MAYADPAVQRQRDRERFARRTAARKATGLCPRCGVRPPAPERSVCAPCAEKCNRVSALPVSDGMVIGLFDGCRVRFGGTLSGCRTAVDAVGRWRLAGVLPVTVTLPL